MRNFLMLLGRRWAVAAMLIAVFMLAASFSFAAPRVGQVGREQAVVPIAQPIVSGISESTELGPVNPFQTLDFTVSLPFGDPDGAQAYADAVSDPKSSLYRHFIEPEDNASMFGLPTETRNKIEQYLRANNFAITTVARTGLGFICTATVADIQAAFHMQINAYVSRSQFDTNGQPLYYIANDSPVQLPADIAPYVEGVYGINTYDRPQHRSVLSPTQTRTLYNLSAFWGSGTQGEGRNLGISNFDGYRLTNVPLFYSAYGLPTPSGGVGSNITVVVAGTAAGGGTAQGEGDLDIQMILGQAPLCNFYIYDSTNEVTALTKEASDNICDVISESYGWTSGVAAGAHTQHVAMTTQGITYMCASGDSGTTWTSGGNYYDYPNADPEVLLVGGTAAQVNGSGVRQSEVGWNGSGSGYTTNTYSWGGRPSWQVAQGIPSSTTYPKRIVPDVAFHASGTQTTTQGAYTFYYNGSANSGSVGTSFACPVFCGGLGVSEQKIIANGGLPANGAGKRRFGRIQDLFYSQNNPTINSTIWYDVTTGGNVGTLPGTSTSVSCAAGWDWATGLGCINWNAFVASQSSPNPVPTLTSINPTSGTVGSGLTITATGTNFVNSSTINWNGTALTTTYVSATSLTAVVPAANLSAAGTATITVTNPAPGGGTTSGLSFAINNPSPTITSLSPSSVLTGASTTTVTINGTGFVSTSVAKIGSTSLTTTYVSSTQLTVSLAASYFTAATTYNITVTNPAPGGGTSSAAVFSVNNPAPVATSLSPATVLAGGSSYTMNVNGLNFTAASVVNWAGASTGALTTTFVDANTLKATVPASYITSTGTATVTVVTPTPGGGTSAGLTVTINNPAPTLSSVSPNSATAGDGNTVISLTGTGFVSGSTVNWNGSALATTYVSSTSLTAIVSSGRLTTAGTATITVVNGTPGGGTSSGLTFTVNNPVPTLTSVSPNSVVAGASATTVTLTGTNFLPSSVAKWNGASLSTTYVNSTTVTANIPAANLTTAGSFNISVSNPTPGGGSSGNVTFTVKNLTPVLSSIAPTSAVTLTPGLTLTVNGSNFQANSTVLWNGSARTTTYVSSTVLTASILPADLLTATSASVSVSTPGGGTSGTAPFAVTQTTVTGKVDLSAAYVGDWTLVPVAFEIRNVGSTTAIIATTVTLDPSGNYTWVGDIAPGSYDLTGKPSHWVRGLDSNVTFGSSSITPVNFAPLNGDIDGNNIININDYAILSDAFNSHPGDALWDARADLDGNGVININDYAILSDNFGVSGAP